MGGVYELSVSALCIFVSGLGLTECYSTSLVCITALGYTKQCTHPHQLDNQQPPNRDNHAGSCFVPVNFLTVLLPFKNH